MGYRTDRQRVKGLGTAGSGTGHWWRQRVTAVALVVLTGFFLFPFASSLGADFETVRATYASPFNAIVAILFILTACIHLQLGLQVVIEDYVSGHASRTALVLASNLLTWALALTGVFAVARIAFSA